MKGDSMQRSESLKKNQDFQKFKNLEFYAEFFFSLKRLTVLYAFIIDHVLTSVNRIWWFHYFIIIFAPNFEHIKTLTVW